MTVLFLDQPACQEAGTAGGKGASLARMASLGVAVPPAFVVSADALVAALPDGGELKALVRAHEDGGWPEVDLIQAADSLSFLEDAVAAEVAES
jgi:hypothetical protein